MIVNRRGITRTVIITRRYAIKIPSFRTYGDGFAGMLWSVCRGILANQSEAMWWKHSPPDTPLCPVLRSWLGCLINVYPRCRPFEVSAERELEMHNREWFPVEMDPQASDNKPENYGWLNGRVVLLDYDMNWNGCPHDRSGRQAT